MSKSTLNELERSNRQLRRENEKLIAEIKETKREEDVKPVVKKEDQDQLIQTFDNLSIGSVWFLEWTTLSKAHIKWKIRCSLGSVSRRFLGRLLKTFFRAQTSYHSLLLPLASTP